MLQSAGDVLVNTACLQRPSLLLTCLHCPYSLPPYSSHTSIDMRYLSLLALVASSATALSIDRVSPGQNFLGSIEEERFLVEIEPGKTKWVVEEDKWEMRRVCSPLAYTHKANDFRMALISWTSRTHSTPTHTYYSQREPPSAIQNIPNITQR